MATAMRVLSREDAEDLVLGATILGTGGGGDPREGLQYLLQDITSQRPPRIASHDEVDPDSFVVCAYYCGSIPAPEATRSTAKYRMSLEEVIRKASEFMKHELGGEISAVIPVEIGGGNTPLAIHTATLLDLPVVDADQVGRSTPELVHSTYHVHGVKATPAVVADRLGDLILVSDYADIDQYERIARTIAILAGGSSFVIDTPVRAQEIARLAIIGSVTRSIQIGRRVREARERREDAVESVVHFLDGYRLFKGKVSRFNLKEEHGFLIGTIDFSGLGDFKGRRFRIWVKNENIIAWRNGRLVAMAPDPVMVLDSEGNGITNSNIRRGLEVQIIGARSPDVWRTPKGIELLGPRHFGFKFDYRPIEKLVA